MEMNNARGQKGSMPELLKCRVTCSNCENREKKKGCRGCFDMKNFKERRDNGAEQI